MFCHILHSCKLSPLNELSCDTSDTSHVLQFYHKYHKRLASLHEPFPDINIKVNISTIILNKKVIWNVRSTTNTYFLEIKQVGLFLNKNKDHDFFYTKMCFF